MAKATKKTAQKEQNVLSVVSISTIIILPSKNNPRKSINEDSIRELANSMELNGLLQPITIRPDADGYEIVAGERRWRAAKLLEWATIPAIIRQVSDEDMLEIQVLENLQREDMSPLDEAGAFQSLLKKESIDWLSSKIHKSKKYVLDRIKLNDLCLEAQLYLTNGVLPLGHAVLLSKIKEEDQDKILKGIITTPYNDKGINDSSLSYCFKTLSDLKSLISNTFTSFTSAPFSLSNENLIEGVPSCNDCDKRTCNQNLLFNDITEKDVCTDTICFNNKIKAHIDDKFEEAKYQYVGVLKGEYDPCASSMIKVKGQSLYFKEKKEEGLTPVVITKTDNWRKETLGKTVWVKLPEEEEIENKKSNSSYDYHAKEKELFINDLQLLNKILPSVINGTNINRSGILDTLLMSLLDKIELKYLLVFAHALNLAIPTEIESVHDYVKDLLYGEIEELKPELIKSIWSKCYQIKPNDSLLKIITNLYYIGETISDREDDAGEIGEYNPGVLSWQGYVIEAGIKELIKPEE